MKQINQREITLYIFLNTNHANRTNNKNKDAVRTSQVKIHSAWPLISQLSTLNVPRSSELQNLRTSEQDVLSHLSTLNPQLSTFISQRLSLNVHRSSVDFVACHTKLVCRFLGHTYKICKFALREAALLPYDCKRRMFPRFY